MVKKQVKSKKNEKNEQTGKIALLKRELAQQNPQKRMSFRKIKKRKNKCIINNIIKQQQLIKNKIDKENKIKNQIEEIKNSNINFSKFGWVNKVSKILKITPQKVNCWMKKNMLEFYNNNCFKCKRRVREEVITRGT